jgi:hypothetical protein
MRLTRRAFFQALGALSASAALPALPAPSWIAAPAKTFTPSVPVPRAQVRAATVSVLAREVDVSTFEEGHRSFSALGAPQHELEVDLLLTDAAVLPQVGDVIGSAWFKDNCGKQQWLAEHMPGDLRFSVESVMVWAAPHEQLEARLLLRETVT